MTQSEATGQWGTGLSASSWKTLCIYSRIFSSHSLIGSDWENNLYLVSQPSEVSDQIRSDQSLSRV